MDKDFSKLVILFTFLWVLFPVLKMWQATEYCKRQLYNHFKPPLKFTCSNFNTLFLKCSDTKPLLHLLWMHCYLWGKHRGHLRLPDLSPVIWKYKWPNSILINEHFLTTAWTSIRINYLCKKELPSTKLPTCYSIALPSWATFHLPTQSRWQ